MFDCVIRNGLVIDGTGSPGRVADIAIRDGLIAQVGGAELSGRAEIEAGGMAVCPGFIDVHTHDDRLPLVDPLMTAKLSQGVTTVVTGNCGISAFPVPGTADAPAPMTLLGLRAEDFFARFEHYASAVSAVGPAVNIAPLIGHTSLRAAVMDDLTQPASDAERERMRELLDAALRAGVRGLSTGLYYPPAAAAPSEEVEALLSVVADHGGIYCTHMRDEGDNLLGSLEESLGSAARAGVALVISHLKCASPRVWGQAGKVLARLEEAALRQPVAFDMYPYEASSTMLRADAVVGVRKVTVSWSSPYPDEAGQDLAEVAARWCCSPEEAVQRLSPAGAIYYRMQEKDVRKIAAHPMAMIGSDGLPHDRHPHPRLWGTFPRVIGRYVREWGLFPLEDAVRRTTSLPARVFGLSDRGVIAEGMAADMLIFDPDTILDTATYDAPTGMARGVGHVIVNGVPAWSDGEAAGRRAGRILSRAAH
jgi:N-acyl-D-amino-acid deacylase